MDRILITAIGLAITGTVLAAPIECRQTKQECFDEVWVVDRPDNPRLSDKTCIILSEQHWSDRYGTDVKECEKKATLELSIGERLKYETDNVKRQAIKDATKLSDLPYDIRFDYSTDTPANPEAGFVKGSTTILGGIIAVILMVIGWVVSVFVRKK